MSNSYRNNIMSGPDKRGFSYGPEQTTSQLNTSTSAKSNYQPRTPMVYSHSPKVPRYQFTESEPLSPYSEMQIPMTPMRPTQQLNPGNNTYFRSQEAFVQNPLIPYPQMATSNFQNSQLARSMEMRSQRMRSHDVQGTPYARFPIIHPTQQSLLPPPTPRHNPTITYKPEQSLGIQSTKSSSADWNVSQNVKKHKGATAGFTMMNNDGLQSSSQTDKLNSMSPKRFLIGSIDQIIQWNKLAKTSHLYVIYEVTGILENISYNHEKKVYKMIIRDDHKTSFILQAVFFPIDRDVPEVRTGALITFVGRMIGARKLQVLNMWPTNANSLAGLKRISFLCQRTLQESCLSAPEP